MPEPDSPSKAAETMNLQTVRRLYKAFGERDAATMAACYHPDARFSDPVFQDLHGTEIGQMWSMLGAGAKDLTITATEMQADATAGSALWVATYTFSRTGRPVRNVITARFLFRDGLIVDHKDRFGFWRWSRQALGPTGLFLGWTPMVRSKVRADARGRLIKFMAENPKA